MALLYPTLQMPVAILFGRSDQVLDPTKHGAPLRDVVAGATMTPVCGGHMIVFTAPDVVADWILPKTCEVVGGANPPPQPDHAGTDAGFYRTLILESHPQTGSDAAAYRSLGFH